MAAKVCERPSHTVGKRSRKSTFNMMTEEMRKKLDFLHEELNVLHEDLEILREGYDASKFIEVHMEIMKATQEITNMHQEFLDSLN